MQGKITYLDSNCVDAGGDKPGSAKGDIESSEEKRIVFFLAAGAEERIKYYKEIWTSDFDFKKKESLI